ncbi:MAG: hypothetical protein K0R41_2375 [Geminicoccaceae bacterium]|jgi:hypothetical protein|nr:hypothetical protein [Geminicoccaceae bacterium]
MVHAMDLRIRASAARREAGRLEELARGVRDRVDSVSGRDRGADEQRLLGRAAVTDQQARVLEAAGQQRS